MKKISVLFIAFVLLLSLSGCKSLVNTIDKIDDIDDAAGSDLQNDNSAANEQKTKLTADEANTIAFTHAGVAAADVYDLSTEFDKDDGVESYEIDFKSNNIEYEYDIDAYSGEILKSEKDVND